MANQQKTNFVIEKIRQFPLSAVVGAMAAGGNVPWTDLANWVVGLLPFFSL